MGIGCNKKSVEMVDTTERQYIHKLRKAECVQLLEELGLEGTGSVQLLRARLISQAKKATPEEITIFHDHKIKFQQRKEKEVFQNYAQRLPFPECHALLEDFKIEGSGSEEAQRSALVEALNNTVGEDRETWVDVAEGFCEEVQVPKTSSTRVKDSAEMPDPSEYDSAEDSDSQNRESQRNCRKTSRSLQNSSSDAQLPKMALLMDQVRKWNLKFQGGAPDIALQFIEDLEEKALAYEIPLDRLPQAMPELLKGSASNWFRSNKEEWKYWEDFKDSFYQFFVPSRLRVELEDEVRACKQKPHQSIHEYIIEIQTLMRRIPGLSEIEKLNRIYANLTCEYQLYIKRHEFMTLKDLKSLGEDFEYKIHHRSEKGQLPNPRQRNRDFHRSSGITAEALPQSPPSFQTSQSRPNDSRSQPNPPQDTIPPHSASNALNAGRTTSANLGNPKQTTDRPIICYNCDRQGHSSRFCHKPPRPYCKFCRRRGIRTEECNCQRDNSPPAFCSLCRRHGYTNETCPCSTPGVSSNRESMSSINNEHSSVTDQRPRRYVEVLGKKFDALLDTGATASYINHKVVDWLEANRQPSIDVNINTYMANQASDCANKAYQLEIRVGEKVISSQFIVMKGMLDEMTIGNDCLGLLRYELVDLDQRSYRMASLIHREMLETTEEERLKELLDEELPKCCEISGGTEMTEHRIIMKNDVPIRQRYFPKNPVMREVINKQIDELLNNGQIEASASPYCSPIVLVKKKDHTWRMCIDFRKINENSERDAYPMPHIPSILSRLQKAKYVSSIDLKNGYWQVPIRPEDRQFTAFVVPGRGLFQWRVMPFGLHSAPATFQRLLDSVVGQKYEAFAIPYLDDIIIFSESFEEHLEHLQTILQALRKANLKINTEKSVFCKKELRYLGHVVGQGGIQTDPDKVKAIKDLPAPTDITGVRRVLGMVGWYSKFVPNYTEIVAPLNSLLSKNTKFSWGKEQQEAFKRIKQKMTEAPIISCPDFSRPFYLQTDASSIGLGAVLFQRDGDNERVIAFSSRTLNAAEKNYSTTEKECLAVVWGIAKNREYLEGIPFTVITDHLSLKWIFKLPNPTGRLGRWVLELRNHDFVIEYRKGKLNVVPDALSRDPLFDEKSEHCSSLKLGENSWLGKQMSKVSGNPENYPEFQIVEGQLFRNCGYGDITESNWKLCVGESDRIRVLKENHCDVTAGHFGNRKTYNRISQRYYWPGMFKDVKQFVNRCHDCLQIKSSQQKPAGQMHTAQTHTPWEIVTVDFVGPLPRSSKLNKHLLVIQDKFTKWVECVPMREATAVGLKKAIRERIFSRFGWPKKLISDNGAQFTSKAFTKFLEENFVFHVLTPPYSPQCNSTERANRTVKTLIKIYLRDNQKKWDDQLPEIQFAINTAVQDSTGFSPAEMNFGRTLRPPNSFFESQTGRFANPPTNTAEQKDKIQEILQIASRNLAKAQSQQAKFYNRKRRQWAPEINEIVYKREFHQSKASEGFAAKLAPSFRGPFRVVSFISPSIVEVVEHPERPGKTKSYRVHLKDIKQVNQQDWTAADENFVK